MLYMNYTVYVSERYGVGDAPYFFMTEEVTVWPLRRSRCGHEGGHCVAMEEVTVWPWRMSQLWPILVDVFSRILA